MNFLVPIALFGWVPVVLFLFAMLPPRRAVITSILVAWLFLPMAGLPIPGFPDFTKMNATSVGILLGCMIFDQARIFTFRARWFDLPMVIWCFVPFVSSIVNGLGVYDGISATIAQIFIWGLPYLIGRVYFSDLDALRELAIGIFIGGLIYVPLCLIEIKMSPQLHKWVYGYHPADFAMAIRFGGYRPTVFMQHGLMVAMWMAAATLMGVWLWYTQSVREIRGIPMVVLVPLLGATTLACRSMNSMVLLAVGLGAMFATGWFKTRLFLAALIIVGPVYIALRLSDVWGGEQLAALAALVDADRASSLQTRLNNESMLSDRALQQPIFGWGGWGRARVRNESGRDVSTTDGLWIIAVGNNGIVGLTSWMAALLLPAALLLKYSRPIDWAHPVFASAGALGILLVLYFLDCIMNAMVNPVFTIAAGGVIGLQALRGASAPAPQPPPRGFPVGPPHPQQPALDYHVR
jgi:hypothetical protein